MLIASKKILIFSEKRHVIDICISRSWLLLLFRDVDWFSCCVNFV